MADQFIRRCLILALALIVAALPFEAAQAEEVSIYGVNLPAVRGGGFQPAGTNFICFGFDKDSRCWDGKTWQSIYPLGPRHFSRTNAQVDCVVVTKITGDCWDGHTWYKLPLGTVFGVVLPSVQGGAFRTTPLPPDAQR